MAFLILIPSSTDEQEKMAEAYLGIKALSTSLYMSSLYCWASMTTPMLLGNMNYNDMKSCVLE